MALLEISEEGMTELLEKVRSSRTINMRMLLSVISIDRLLALWDAYDGSNKPLGIDGYAIHVELVRRGEGWVCASC